MHLVRQSGRGAGTRQTAFLVQRQEPDGIVILCVYWRLVVGSLQPILPGCFGLGGQ